MWVRHELQVNGSVGKQIRFKRLVEPDSGASIVVALDHGMTSPRFLEGLSDTRARISEAIGGGATALMLSRGSAATYCDAFAGRVGLALMLTASAAGDPRGPRVAPIGSVDEAGRLGADAVVVYVALNGEDEREMISYLSAVGEACAAKGMPLIAEAEFPNAYADRDSMPVNLGVEYLRRNARLCAELGADIIKLNWSGDVRTFASVVEACDRPVIVAGGPVVPDGELLQRMEGARAAGAIGCSVGRNMFEHRDPAALARALSRVFAAKWSADDALAELEGSVSAIVDGSRGQAPVRTPERHGSG